MNRKYDATQVKVNQVRVEFSNKSASVFGGLPLTIAKLLEVIDFRSWVEQSVPFTETSPNARGVYGKVLGLFIGVLSGGKRFSHWVTWGQGAEVLQEAFGVHWLPGAASVFTRFFSRFDRQSSAEQWGERLREFAWQVVAWSGVSSTDLNFDSTVQTRYGKQQGAKKGYNPRRPGRPSHHPLLAFLGAGYVVNLWNRSGDSHSANGIIGFFEQTFLQASRAIRIRWVLCDSGFHQAEFIRHLEGKEVRYVIAARLSRYLQREILRLRDWRRLDDGIEIAEFRYAYASGDDRKERRYIAVRQDSARRPTASGRQPFLFKEFEEHRDYRYGVWVTNEETAPAEEIWRAYRPRAKDENVIKTLKTDLGVDGYCLDDFWATEAVMGLIALVFYNLTHFLGTLVSPAGPEPTLGTMRRNLLLLPALLGRSGGRAIIRVAVKDRGLRGRLLHLYYKIASLSLSLNCNAISAAHEENFLPGNG